MTVRMIVAVRSDGVSVSVLVGVGAGAGAGAPGESICPAKAETASAKLRIATAHVWRRVFIVVSYT
jgi:hypothetical protein